MTDHTEELQRRAVADITTEFARLHQRIAALEAENERLESLISGARRVTSAVIEERDSFQREGIRAMERLETARGLLERITAAHDCTALNEARAFLAATPAQEVRQSLSAENQRVVPVEPLLYRAMHAALSAQQSDPWAPSDADYDHAIHRNPDAKAWADFFVYTFPGLADKRELMISWFANAMMAMHDHLKAQQPEFCCEHSYKVAKQAAWGARDLTQCKCDHNEYCEHCWPDDFKEGGKWHNGFEAKQSAPEAK
jgi:hypothetical protein